MHFSFVKKTLYYNSILLIFFGVLFLFFPKIDIYLSSLFFFENKFISEKYYFIKDLRIILKNIMICIPIISVILLIIDSINKKQKIKKSIKFRTKFALIGLILGPLIGCGLIANLYFKDTWGRARPVHIEEFGGKRIFTPPFIKSDQCEKNCSWISGETSGAFSFIVGTILLKNHIYLIFNIILGFLVFFCRLSMGGHFFSDNVFAMIFMIYLAILYKSILYSCLKRKLLYEKSTNNN